MLTGCGVSLTGTWVDSNNDSNSYVFNDDGSCVKKKGTVVTNCSYVKTGSLVDIYVNGVLSESGQWSNSGVILGSVLYKKAK